MLDSTYKNSNYKEIIKELQKKESTFNGEIYYFDELIKEEKTLEIVEFIKNEKILILKNKKAKKIIIRLIKGEKDYFASVQKINTKKYFFDSKNKTSFLFDKVSDFGTIKNKENIHLFNKGKEKYKTSKNIINKEIDLIYFTCEKNNKKAYCINPKNGDGTYTLTHKNYILLESDFSDKLNDIKKYLFNS